jgi:hypothetical protein
MRSIGLLLCLTISAQAIAQAPATPQFPFTTKGAFFGLSVADVEASAKWYAEKFGLQVVLRPPKFDGATAVILEGNGLIVELVQRDDAMPLSKAAPSVTQNSRVHGFFKAGIIVDDFDATVARLRRAAWRSPWVPTRRRRRSGRMSSSATTPETSFSSSERGEGPAVILRERSER